MDSIGAFSIILIPSGILIFAALELETDQEMSFDFHPVFLCVSTVSMHEHVFILCLF